MSYRDLSEPKKDGVGFSNKDGGEQEEEGVKLTGDPCEQIIPGKGGRTKGLGYLRTAYFIIAQMTGVGFLALPRSLANTGWFGIPMLVIFCISVGFAASRLGKSWVILEERWPKYRLPARQPYMEIAGKAFGNIGRKICLVSVLLTLMGYCIAFTILIGGMLNSLVPHVSLCTWCVIVSIVICPATFLESPKDFWQASILAVVSTALAIIIIIIQLVLDKPEHPDPTHSMPDVVSFSLGFSAILFAFGGASAFPTLQNDMEDRNDWWKSVAVGFFVILCLYMPVALAGYIIIGDDVGDNIILDVTEGPLVIVAIAFVMANLFSTYIICINPVDQAFEEILNVPKSFNIKRVLVRSAIVCFVLLICLAVPRFGIVLNLFGGSTITALSFIFPPLMYLWLVDMKSEGAWNDITIPLWERIYLWCIVAVGVVGGITSTVSAIMKIMDPEVFGSSCFTSFNNVTA